MRLKANKLVLVILVGCFIMTWRAHTDRDVAVAQGRKAVVITRIFTGPDGLAHAEDINLIEDTTGKGHVTRNFGPEDRIALTIPLADGVVIDGIRKARTR
jgi:hypothetical protein